MWAAGGLPAAELKHQMFTIKYALLDTYLTGVKGGACLWLDGAASPPDSLKQQKKQVTTD